MKQHFVIFTVDTASYAVPIQQVAQVEMVENITRVPNTPDFVQGMAHIRGQVAPVINVRRRFSLPDRPVDVRSRLLVITLDGRTVALLVDSAREFHSLEGEALPLPVDLQGPGREFLRGIIPFGERLLLLVDLEALLNAEERHTLREAQGVERG